MFFIAIVIVIMIMIIEVGHTHTEERSQTDRAILTANGDYSKVPHT